MNYKEPKLLIQTFEEEHKGIYQCVATNIAGEMQSTGLLNLKQKDYNEKPKNAKCYPINLSSFRVTFEGPQHYKVNKRDLICFLFSIVICRYFIFIFYLNVSGLQ